MQIFRVKMKLCEKDARRTKDRVMTIVIVLNEEAARIEIFKVCKVAERTEKKAIL